MAASCFLNQEFRNTDLHPDLEGRLIADKGSPQFFAVADYLVN